MVSDPPTIPSSSSSSLSSMTIKILLASTIFLISCTLSTFLGGYGYITWSLHPLSMYLAVLLFLPLSFGDLAKSLEYSAIAKQYPSITGTTLHVILNVFGFFCILFGYFIAWYVHELKGKNHFPPLTKGIVRVLHVYVGFFLILIIIFQAILGTCRYLGLSYLRNFHSYHSSIGRILWAISLFVLGGGVYIMLIEGSNSWLTASLCILTVGVVAQRILKT
jgi:hypothetical protein